MQFRLLSVSNKYTLGGVLQLPVEFPSISKFGCKETGYRRRCVLLARLHHISQPHTHRDGTPENAKAIAPRPRATRTDERASHRRITPRETASPPDPHPPLSVNADGRSTARQTLTRHPAPPGRRPRTSRRRAWQRQRQRGGATRSVRMGCAVRCAHGVRRGRPLKAQAWRTCNRKCCSETTASGESL